MDTSNLGELMRESLAHLQPMNGYKDARWHDLVVLCVMTRVFQEGSDSWRLAVAHLSNLNSMDPGITDWYKKFNCADWS
ncbi:MAG: hypothetical protein K8J08_13720 [Thermoanaerobaculia bacterium]|nr:hypothetical protein [Thermoanaerobaculia bacterium]